MAAQIPPQGNVLIVSDAQYCNFLHQQMSMTNATATGVICLMGCDIMEKLWEIEDGD